MTVCPLDYRYGRDTMKIIFDEENRLALMLEIEAALARAHAKVGNILEEDAEIISAKATTEFVTLSRVKELERDNRRRNPHQ